MTAGLRAGILDSAKNLTFGDRNATYGDPLTNHRQIAIGWSVIFGKRIEPHQVALAMAWVKTARMVTTPKHADSPVDMAAYAAIAGELAMREDEEFYNEDTGLPIEPYDESVELTDAGEDFLCDYESYDSEWEDWPEDETDDACSCDECKAGVPSEGVPATTPAENTEKPLAAPRSVFKWAVECGDQPIAKPVTDPNATITAALARLDAAEKNAEARRRSKLYNWRNPPTGVER